MRSTDFLKKLRKDNATIISETEGIRRLTSKDAMIQPVFLYPDDDATR